MLPRIILAILILTAAGCFDSAKMEEEKKLEAYREAETIVAFGSVNFGDSVDSVKQKLGTTQDFEKEPIYLYTVGGISVAMIFKFSNGGLYKVTIRGSDENIGHLRAALTEKYKLSSDIGYSTSDTIDIPGHPTYDWIQHFYGVGSRKEIKFSTERYRTHSNEEIIITDKDVEMKINYEESKQKEDKYNAKKRDAKKLL